MPRPKNKKELLIAAKEKYTTLMGVISHMSENQLNLPFDFSNDTSKKEAHWNRDKNVRDVLIHLYEWHQLMIQFIKNNADRKTPVAFIPAPYTWRTYGDMNLLFWKRHQNTDIDVAKVMLKNSHTAVLVLIENYSDTELFTKQYFNWTGTTTLGSYFVSATSSHYDWAIKKIKAHCKRIA